MRTLRFSLILLLSLTAFPLFSATYVVPADRELVSAARAIVSGTVTATQVRRARRIETVTAVAVEEWMKGTGGQAVSVVLPGGRLGDERLTVPGVPAFHPGDRVLLFLTRNGRGEWTTLAFGLGAFVADGRGVLAREEVFGWTEDGARHEERARLERPFAEYVRAVVRGEVDAPSSYFAEGNESSMLRVQPDDAAYVAGSYSFSVDDLPLRRNGAVAEWRISGEAGDLDLTKAADTGVAAWASVSATYRDTRGAPATGDLDGDDGEWRIIADDPHNEIPDVCCFGIVAGAFLIDNGSHVYDGQTFRTLTHADLLLNDGISSASFSQDQLDDIVTHEIGHSLGLRHADRNSANDAVCPAGANCCVYSNDGGNCMSVMSSLENPKVTGLHRWDRDAIACLYEGNCTVPCTAPAFLDTPQGSVIYVNTSSLLWTRVLGTPPLTVQWYQGLQGDTSHLVTSGEWELRVRPQETTKYWVRVTDACGQIDSDAALISVIGCPNVRIVHASATIVAPGRVRLLALAAGGSRYRWYKDQGPGRPGSLLGLSRDLTISYTGAPKYWVAVENTCGNAAVSEVLTPSTEAPPIRQRRVRH